MELPIDFRKLIEQEMKKEREKIKPVKDRKKNTKLKFKMSGVKVKEAVRMRCQLCVEEARALLRIVFLWTNIHSTSALYSPVYSVGVSRDRTISHFCFCNKIDK